MNRLGFVGIVAFSGVVLAGVPGCARVGVADFEAAAASDAAFAAMQVRGQQAMGVDQYTSTHLFDALPDGGRIELQRAVDDPAGVAQIRQHLQEIARAFTAGEFSTPAFVHMRPVPGTSVMAAKRDAITYTYRELPRGGEVRIVTQDPEALQAIHEFMAFQRQDHRAGGMEHGDYSGRMEHGDHTAGMEHGAPISENSHQQDAVKQHDGGFAADMQVVHELLLDHKAIRRTVTHLPNGVRTVTESDDPRVAAYVIEHVASMVQRLADGDVFNVASPTIPTIFANADRIHTEIEETPTGVIFTQTSEDPELVGVLQAHAAEVTDLAREGMAAMMRSVMESGGHMNHSGAAEHGQMGPGGMHGPMGGMMNGGGPIMENMTHPMMRHGAPAARMRGNPATPEGDGP